VIVEAMLPEGRRLPQGEKADEAAGETTPGGEKPVRWQVVAVAHGLAEAAIIQGRLEFEGIPARVHQEAVGVVYGLTIGPLGQAKVLVPEALAEQALDVLSGETAELDDPDPDQATDEKDSVAP